MAFVLENPSLQPFHREQAHGDLGDTMIIGTQLIIGAAVRAPCLA